MKIQLLSEFVVDQIAAGEVLENPSSAVKELLENSLDAGATEILIEIEAGGLQRIMIEDDGCGMGSKDASICLKRHATSKIRSAEDLEKLVTMGFRGEALAALASVTKLELKTSDGVESTRITSDGLTEPTARNRGTTIDARSMFYNAPARLKFQKSPGACAAAVLKVVQSVSLSNPTVGFRLLSNGKLTFQVAPSDWKRRAEEVLGPFAHEIKSTEQLRGLFGRPEESKMNRSGQMVYINRRPIHSPLISKAVKDGFGTRMVDSLFPVFILFLELPSDTVDVNVHPQKREVRFRDEKKIFSLVRNAIAATFEQHAPTFAPLPWEFTSKPSGAWPRSAAAPLPWESATPSAAVRRESVGALPQNAAAPFSTSLSGGDAPLPWESATSSAAVRHEGDGALPQNAAEPPSTSLSGGDAPLPWESATSSAAVRREGDGTWPQDVAVPLSPGPVSWEAAVASYEPTFCMEDAPLGLPIEVVAQPKVLLGDFLLVEGEGWFLVDVRGAQARILFEEMGKSAPSVQPLLWPMEIAGTEEFVEQLQGIGIESRMIGKRQIAIDAAPEGLDLGNFIECFRSERSHAAAVTRVCRAAKRRYVFEQACAIWRALQGCKDRMYDPLGRKICVELTKEQLTKYFQ